MGTRGSGISGVLRGATGTLSRPASTSSVKFPDGEEIETRFETRDSGYGWNESTMFAKASDGSWVEIDTAPKTTGKRSNENAIFSLIGFKEAGRPPAEENISATMKIHNSWFGRNRSVFGSVKVKGQWINAGEIRDLSQAKEYLTGAKNTFSMMKPTKMLEVDGRNNLENMKLAVDYFDSAGDFAVAAVQTDPAKNLFGVHGLCYGGMEVPWYRTHPVGGEDKRAFLKNHGVDVHSKYIAVRFTPHKTLQRQPYIGERIYPDFGDDAGWHNVALVPAEDVVFTGGDGNYQELSYFPKKFREMTEGGMTAFYNKWHGKMKYPTLESLAKKSDSLEEFRDLSVKAMRPAYKAQPGELVNIDSKTHGKSSPFGSDYGTPKSGKVVRVSKKSVTIEKLDGSQTKIPVSARVSVNLAPMFDVSGGEIVNKVSDYYSEVKGGK